MCGAELSPGVRCDWTRESSLRACGAEDACIASVSLVGVSSLQVLGGVYVVRVEADFPRVIPACRAEVADSDRTRCLIEFSLRVRAGADRP